MIFAELHEAAKVYLAKHAIDGVKDAADSYLSFHNTEVLLDYFELVVAAMDGSMHPNPFLIIHCQHWMKYCCCSSKVLCKSRSEKVHLNDSHHCSSRFKDYSLNTTHPSWFHPSYLNYLYLFSEFLVAANFNFQFSYVAVALF